MGKLNKIFKISSTDFATLKEQGQITKAGVTYKYDPDNLYLIENNLTDDYVLLGGGGSKLESELSVKKATQDGNGAVIADTYVKKESGKGLSTNDYTTAEKTKLSGIATGANKTTITNNLTTTSTGTALDAAQGKILNDKFTSGLYEANLKWGGRNITDAVSPVDAAMVTQLTANRLDFLNPNCIKIEYSTDGGTTWVDYNASDADKTNLVSTTYYNSSFRCGKKDVSDTKTTQDRLRITLYNFNGYLYTGIRKFIMYVTTNSCKNCWCTIRRNTWGAQDTFIELATKQPISGWSGWNVINVPLFYTHCNADSQAERVELIFGMDTIAYPTYSSLNISKLFAFGETCYGAYSSVAKLGTIYTIDANAKSTFVGAVDAPSLLENGALLSNKYALKTAIPTVESLTTTDIDNAIK